MCISFWSECIALKSAVCFSLIIMNKERQNPKPPGSSMALNNREMYKYRKKEDCFFNHSLTKWQNVSAEVEICKSVTAGICLKDGDELF